ncbi:hypothetical protein Shyd_74640 [Streptomyces hydrogenans]|uniref:Uncharacterized protein n=1 Tax=Streptomyces hydrogenans TaxID=1873719 RepID=A0ABQ3PM41_9ACTN|nr:hypothetical protein GCM10018784_04830 [Streptomyces hydrogenans]GHI26093.1 hypothetical protein Shyd_74640 [Streptomyces hydrogenans]
MRGSIRDPEEGEQGSIRDPEGWIRWGSAYDPADGGRVVRAFSGPFSPRGLTPDGDRREPTARRADVRAGPREGPVPAADPAGAYGTQWLPETVIITWSWMLAEK